MVRLRTIGRIGRVHLITCSPAVPTPPAPCTPAPRAESAPAVPPAAAHRGTSPAPATAPEWPANLAAVWPRSAPPAAGWPTPHSRAQVGVGHRRQLPHAVAQLLLRLRQRGQRVDGQQE